MRKTVIVGLTMIGALAFVGMPANAALHDACNGDNPGADAGNTAVAASPLANNNCTGETLLGNDPADWYFEEITVPSLTGTTATVTLCPTITKTGPWNPNLEVYFLAGTVGGSGSVGPINYNIPGLPGNPPPGPLLGQSNNAAGCDTVNASQTGVTLGGKWYLQVTIASGDGFYSLVSNFS